MRKWEFEHEMSFGEFLCMHAGHIRKKDDQYKQLRLMMWAAIRPHTKRNLQPEDLIKLRSDKRNFEPVDIEEYKTLRDGKADTGSEDNSGQSAV